LANVTFKGDFVDAGAFIVGEIARAIENPSGAVAGSLVAPRAPWHLDREMAVVDVGAVVIQRKDDQRPLISHADGICARISISEQIKRLKDKIGRLPPFESVELALSGRRSIQIQHFIHRPARNVKKSPIIKEVSGVAPTLGVHDDFSAVLVEFDDFRATFVVEFAVAVGNVVKRVKTASVDV
jgi:hypothetical protein